jgi:hypothetical protein
VGWSQPITLNGGFGTSTETEGYGRSVTRAQAGLRFGVRRSFALLAGFEMVNKDYGNLFKDAGIEKFTGNEMLWLVGPEFELARGAFLNIQYGMLSNEYKMNDQTTTLDRSLITADVRVKF